MGSKTCNDEQGLSRRGVISSALLGAAGLGAWAGGGAELAWGRPNSAPERSAKRVLRLAHLTDTHVQPERSGQQGFANCLKHVHALDDKPGLILFGGDNVMNVDAQKNTGERAQVQIDIWNRVVKEHCVIPHKTCIGNHDILGLKQDSGKTWAKKQFGLPDRYYSFDQAGWHIIVLDSTEPQAGGGYKGRLDDEQFAWLAKELANTSSTRPVMILSHIPLMSVAAYFDGNNEKSGNWVVPGAWMHIDARRIKDLFSKHPNVKLCLSGHLHLVDQVTYNDVTYCCNGAVSGAWWGGQLPRVRPGLWVG